MVNTEIVHKRISVTTNNSTIALCELLFEDAHISATRYKIKALYLQARPAGEIELHQFAYIETQSGSIQRNSSSCTDII